MRSKFVTEKKKEATTGFQKFKNFMSAVGDLPADAFIFITSKLLGRSNKEPGLLGYALAGIAFLGQSISNFFAAHKKAIAVAAWLSLLTAGAVALTLALWPAALAAVAGFTIGGLSIAAIAGASTVAQVGLAAGLTAAAVSAATYVTAAVANGISWLAGCIKDCRKASSASPSKITELPFNEKGPSPEYRGPSTNISFTQLDSKESKKESKETHRRSDTVPFQPTETVTFLPTSDDIERKNRATSRDSLNSLTSSQELKSNV